jgi:cytochrome c oxidase subunit 2
MSYLPVEGTALSGKVDTLMDFTVWASIISFVLLIGAMVFFIVKYRRRTDADKTAYISHNHFLEFLWSFIPLVIFMAIFYWGWDVYKQNRSFPKDALEVSITGRQWAWDMEYPSGRKATNELVVPVGKDIVLNMSSIDVIHSFYIPAFRIKQDVVPGRRSKLWFNSDRLGDYHLFCSEYCGTAHSGMIGMVKVVTQAEYETWLKKNPATMTPAERGQDLYTVKGCVACHSLDGSIKVGPSWKGLWGSTVKHTDGSTAQFDENYVRQSMMEPQAKIVAGFQGVVMPSFQGQVKEEEINDIIEYIKTLK